MIRSLVAALVMIRSLVAALGPLALAGLLAAMPTDAQEDKAPPRLISLTGHSEVKAEPDMAIRVLSRCRVRSSRL